MTEKATEDIRPPGVDDDEEEVFDNFEDLLNDLDVVDEVGGSDEESKKKDGKKDRNSHKRSSSRDRHRSSHKHRTTRSRSKERQRLPRIKRSLSGSASKNGSKSGGGAAAFLADLKKQFGEFPELVEMNRPSARRQAERELRQNNKKNDRFGNRGQRGGQQQYPQQQQQGWDPMMMTGPMPMQFGPSMPYTGPQMMGGGGMPMMDGSGIMVYPCGPGPVMNPTNMMMGPQMMPDMGMGMQPIGAQVVAPQMNMTPMMVNDGTMGTEGLSMPLQIPGRSRLEENGSFRHSRSPSRRSSRHRSRSRNRFSRSPPPRRTRSRSISRERYRRSLDRGSMDRASQRGRSNYYRPNIDLDELFAANKTTLTTKSLGSSTAYSADTLRNRVISKCKAAVHMLEHPNDIEYNLKFLFVPPAHPATAVDKTGLSPVLPSKRNPLFRFTTARTEVVAASKPFQNLPEHILTLIRQMGLDESLISQKLDETLIASKMLEIRNQAMTSGRDNSFHHRPLMTNNETQTPVLVCRKCEDRDQRLMVNTATQTKKPEQYSASVQTSDTDFTLAKLRFQTWEREKEKVTKRERGEDVGDPEPKRPTIAPPGYRMDTKEPKPINVDPYYASREKTYGYSYRR